MEEATAEKLNFIGRFLKLSDALELCDADKTNLQKSLDERSDKVAEIDELFAIIHKDFPEAFSCDNINISDEIKAIITLMVLFSDSISRSLIKLFQLNGTDAQFLLRLALESHVYALKIIDDKSLAPIFIQHDRKNKRYMKEFVFAKASDYLKNKGHDDLAEAYEKSCEFIHPTSGFDKMITSYEGGNVFITHQSVNISLLSGEGELSEAIVDDFINCFKKVILGWVIIFEKSGLVRDADKKDKIITKIN